MLSVKLYPQYVVHRQINTEVQIIVRGYLAYFGVHL